jgi:hypothetical protein
MKPLNTALTAFYTWWHNNNRYSISNDREAFLAGWEAHKAHEIKQWYSPMSFGFHEYSWDRNF